MIVVQVGKAGRATLTNRTWSAELQPVAKILQRATDDIFIHAGIPNEEEYIVDTLRERMPFVRVVSQTPIEEDPEATDPEPGEGTDA